MSVIQLMLFSRKKGDKTDEMSWMDIVREDMKLVGVREEEAMDRLR